MSENTTSNRKLPYPSSTGLVKNGAEDIKELAEALDITPVFTKTVDQKSLTSMTANYDELIYVSNSSAVEVKLKTNSNREGRSVGVQNYGTGVVTVRCSAGIYGCGYNGDTAIELPKGYSILVVGSSSESGSWIALGGTPIPEGSVTESKLGSEAVTGAKVKSETLPGSKLKGNEVFSGTYHEEAEAGFGPHEYSSTRPCFVTIILHKVAAAAAVAAAWYVGSPNQLVGFWELPGTVGNTAGYTASFIIPAGKYWYLETGNLAALQPVIVRWITL